MWVPGAPGLDGRFQYWGGEGGEKARLDAVESVVSQMMWGVQWIARKRILETNPIPQNIVFRGSRVNVSGMPPVEGPMDWSEFRWEDAYGEAVRVRQRIQDRTLKQFFRGKEGSRTLTYRLREDGRWLRFGLDLRSKKLPEPIQYQLWYLRR